MYCKAYKEDVSKTSLLVVNATNGGRLDGGYSPHLYIAVYINGVGVTSSYTPMISSGGYSNSVTSVETLEKGKHEFSVCFEYRSVEPSTRKASYSISLIG